MDTQQSKELTVSSPTNQGPLSVFTDKGAFENAQRMAQALASSSVVPETYRGNVANTLVALEMANRMGVSPLMVMQNLDIIQGQPSFNAKFSIALINGCGQFSRLRYEWEDRGEKEVEFTYWTGQKPNRQKQTGKMKVKDLACRAYAKDLETGEVLYGPWISIEMAIKEGWYTKSDSKWPTMPENMLAYRAGKFFGNLYAPEPTMGMPTTEELHDIADERPAAPGTLDKLNQKVRNRKTAPEAQPVANPVIQDAEVVSPSSDEEDLI